MISKWFRPAVLAASLIAAADPAAAQGMSGSMQSCESMQSAMMATHEKMSMMKPSGYIDKDYAASMAGMIHAMQQMNAYEIKCGKNAKTKKMAADSNAMMMHAQSKNSKM